MDGSYDEVTSGSSQTINKSNSKISCTDYPRENVQVKVNIIQVAYNVLSKCSVTITSDSIAVNLLLFVMVFLEGIRQTQNQVHCTCAIRRCYMIHIQRNSPLSVMSTMAFSGTSLCWLDWIA